MSSPESSPTNQGAGSPSPPVAKRKGSGLAALVTLALLALLVWALNPRQPKFRPAPLDPPPGACAPSPDFVPSNLTEVPGLALDGLPTGVKNHILLRLNMEPCSCGCAQSLAACRAGNPSCPVSPQACDAVVKDEQAPAGSKKSSSVASK